MSDSTITKCSLCGEPWSLVHDCPMSTGRLPKPFKVPPAPWVPSVPSCPPPLPPTGGTKYDSDKSRMELLDPYAMEQLAKVLTFGAKKYAAHNWRKGISKSRLIAAALRHIFAYLGGTDKDEETGLSHIAHAMCCCMFLLGLEHRTDLDDRYNAGKED